MNRKQASAVIAGTVADAIRERMVAYTPVDNAPVDNAHKALILAYTRQQLHALAELCRSEQLDPGPYLSDTAPAIDAAVRAADAAGLTVPSLPEE